MVMLNTANSGSVLSRIKQFEQNNRSNRPQKIIREDTHYDESTSSQLQPWEKKQRESLIDISKSNSFSSRNSDGFKKLQSRNIGSDTFGKSPQRNDSFESWNERGSAQSPLSTQETIESDSVPIINSDSPIPTNTATSNLSTNNSPSRVHNFSHSPRKKQIFENSTTASPHAGYDKRRENPLRNNPLFLKRMAEVAAAESEEEETMEVRHRESTNDIESKFQKKEQTLLKTKPSRTNSRHSSLENNPLFLKRMAEVAAATEPKEIYTNNGNRTEFNAGKGESISDESKVEHQILNSGSDPPEWAHSWKKSERAKTNKFDLPRSPQVFERKDNHNTRESTLANSPLFQKRMLQVAAVEAKTEYENQSNGDNNPREYTEQIHEEYSNISQNIQPAETKQDNSRQTPQKFQNNNQSIFRNKPKETLSSSPLFMKRVSEVAASESKGDSQLSELEISRSNEDAERKDQSLLSSGTKTPKVIQSRASSPLFLKKFEDDSANYSEEESLIPSFKRTDSNEGGNDIIKKDARTKRVTPKGNLSNSPQFLKKFAEITAIEAEQDDPLPTYRSISSNSVENGNAIKEDNISSTKKSPMGTLSRSPLFLKRLAQVVDAERVEEDASQHLKLSIDKHKPNENEHLSVRSSAVIAHVGKEDNSSKEIAAIEEEQPDALQSKPSNSEENTLDDKSNQGDLLVPGKALPDKPEEKSKFSEKILEEIASINAEQTSDDISQKEVYDKSTIVPDPVDKQRSRSAASVQSTPRRRATINAIRQARLMRSRSPMVRKAAARETGNFAMSRNQKGSKEEEGYNEGSSISNQRKGSGHSIIKDDHSDCFKSNEPNLISSAFDHGDCAPSGSNDKELLDQNNITNRKTTDSSRLLESTRNSSAISLAVSNGAKENMSSKSKQVSRNWNKSKSSDQIDAGDALSIDSSNSKSDLSSFGLSRAASDALNSEKSTSKRTDQTRHQEFSQKKLSKEKLSDYIDDRECSSIISMKSDKSDLSSSALSRAASRGATDYINSRSKSNRNRIQTLRAAKQKIGTTTGKLDKSRLAEKLESGNKGQQRSRSVSSRSLFSRANTNTEKGGRNVRSLSIERRQDSVLRETSTSGIHSKSSIRKLSSNQDSTVSHSKLAELKRNSNGYDKIGVIRDRRRPLDQGDSPLKGSANFDTESVSTTNRLSTNLARLRLLKQQQKRREERSHVPRKQINVSYMDDDFSAESFSTSQSHTAISEIDQSTNISDEHVHRKRREPHESKNSFRTQKYQSKHSDNRFIRNNVVHAIKSYPETQDAHLVSTLDVKNIDDESMLSMDATSDLISYADDFDSHRANDNDMFSDVGDPSRWAEDTQKRLSMGPDTNSEGEFDSFEDQYENEGWDQEEVGILHVEAFEIKETNPRSRQQIESSERSIDRFLDRDQSNFENQTERKLGLPDHPITNSYGSSRPEKNIYLHEKKEKVSLPIVTGEKIFHQDPLEKERLRQEELEQEMMENFRKQEAHRMESERKERERLDAERKQKEEVETKRKEQERLEAVKKERERLEAERKELERLEVERKELERLKAERKEIERLEAEKKEEERLANKKKEEERLEAEKEKERLEAEKREEERAVAERKEEERLEAKRKEREYLESRNEEEKRKEAEIMERRNLTGPTEGDFFEANNDFAQESERHLQRTGDSDSKYVDERQESHVAEQEVTLKGEDRSGKERTNSRLFLEDQARTIQEGFEGKAVENHNSLDLRGAYDLLLPRKATPALRLSAPSESTSLTNQVLASSKAPDDDLGNNPQSIVHRNQYLLHMEKKEVDMDCSTVSLGAPSTFLHKPNKASNVISIDSPHALSGHSSSLKPQTPDTTEESNIFSIRSPSMLPHRTYEDELYHHQQQQSSDFPTHFKKSQETSASALESTSHLAEMSSTLEQSTLIGQVHVRSVADSTSHFGEKSSALEQSTIIGQVHVRSVASGDVSMSKEEPVFEGKIESPNKVVNEEKATSSPLSVSSTATKESKALADWWESTYAATQNADVNSVVQQALSRQSTNDASTIKSLEVLETRNVSKKNSKLSKVFHERKENSSDTEEEDIFSGIEEDSLEMDKGKKKTKEKENNISVNKTHFIPKVVGQNIDWNLMHGRRQNLKEVTRIDANSSASIRDKSLVDIASPQSSGGESLERKKHEKSSTNNKKSKVSNKRSTMNLMNDDPRQDPSHNNRAQAFNPFESTNGSNHQSLSEQKKSFQNDEFGNDDAKGSLSVTSDITTSVIVGPETARLSHEGESSNNIVSKKSSEYITLKEDIILEGEDDYEDDRFVKNLRNQPVGKNPEENLNSDSEKENNGSIDKTIETNSRDKDTLIDNSVPSKSKNLPFLYGYGCAIFDPLVNVCQSKGSNIKVGKDIEGENKSKTKDEQTIVVEEETLFTEDDLTKDDFTKDDYARVDYNEDDYTKDNYRDDYSRDDSKDDYTRDDYTKTDHTDDFSKDDYTKDEYSKDDYTKDGYSEDGYSEGAYSKDDAFSKGDFTKNNDMDGEEEDDLDGNDGGEDLDEDDEDSFSMSAEDENTLSNSIESQTVNKGDDSYSETFEEDLDSRTDASESATMVDTVTSSMSLSEKERRVWDEWDKKDHESSISGVDSTSVLDSSTIMDGTSIGNQGISPNMLGEQERKAQHLERRACAHEKLLLHAYAALSIPPAPIMTEKGEFSGEDDIANYIHHLDIENTAPERLLNVNAARGSQPEQLLPKPNSILKAPKPNILQRQSLEKFCLQIKNEGIEVLKLNRDNKWQVRYLTVSKEGNWIKYNGSNGDRGYCPLGILWVKKFNAKSKEHSVTNIINKQTKGGMLLSHLIRVEESTEILTKYPLSKKQQSKLNDESVAVRLHAENKGVTRYVTFCCSKEKSDSISIGCNAIIDVLKKNNEKEGKTNKAAPKTNSLRRNSDNIRNHERGGEKTLERSGTNDYKRSAETSKHKPKQNRTHHVEEDQLEDRHGNYQVSMSATTAAPYGDSSTLWEA